MEALLSASRSSANPYDFALVCLLGLLGLRVFKAAGAKLNDLGEAHGHRVLLVRGKGGKVVLVPPATCRRPRRRSATGQRTAGPLLLNRNGDRMDRQAATCRLRQLARAARISSSRLHPHMLRRTYVTTMLDAGVDLRGVQVAARHADPPPTGRGTSTLTFGVLCLPGPRPAQLPVPIDRAPRPRPVSGARATNL